jgi:hypothetical protein
MLLVSADICTTLCSSPEADAELISKITYSCGMIRSNHRPDMQSCRANSCPHDPVLFRIPCAGRTELEMRPSGVDELCQVGGLGEASYRVSMMMCKRRSPAELGRTADDFAESVFCFDGWQVRQTPQNISRLSLPLDETTI